MTHQGFAGKVEGVPRRGHRLVFAFAGALSLLGGVVLAGPGTDGPVRTMNGLLPMATWTASKAGLAVTVDVKPVELKTAEILALRITASDSDGGELGIRVRWEASPGATVTGTVDCYADARRPSRPSVRTTTETYAYRHPGLARIAVGVDTTYCPGWGLEPKSVTVEGEVNVRPGPVLTNGPLPLELDAEFLEEESTATRTAIAVWGDDRDGFVHRIDIDWGDGSAPHVLATPLAECHDPRDSWPASMLLDDNIVWHDYPVGEFTARVTARSSGCKGLDEEVKTVELPIARTNRSLEDKPSVAPRVHGKAMHSRLDEVMSGHRTWSGQ